YTPSRFLIKTGQYPLAIRQYLYTIGAPRDPLLAEIVAFATSTDAQKVVTEAGFVDQTIEMQDAAEQREWALSIAANPGGGTAPDPSIPRGAVER
ncbi:hypothetical protein J8J27_25895, partial [Mycobacterium tuberculosis]|nr:hypothetical protein [Mycobacterium tuberculosis]